MKPQAKRYPPAIRPRDSAMTPLPSSFAQQRLWFLEQLEPGNTAYNIPLGVRWRGSMDIAVFERCVSEIVSRHESLRTTFENIDGQPTQVISPPATIDVPVIDLSELPEAEREREVAHQRQLEAQTSFDLGAGPLWRAKVLRLAPQEHILLFTMHHAISDGWSMSVVVREMAALYRAFAAGRPSPLEPLRVQYADYAGWQREWLQGDVLDAQVDYWRKQLAGAPTLLELPTDRPHTKADTRGAALQSFKIRREVVAKLKEIGRREEATLFMVLLAVFAALLSRYSGQNDVLVGTVIAGRQRVELEKLIGFFVNTLVIRADLSNSPSFRELLKRVRTAVLGAYAHQDLPFEKLVEELQPERSLTQTPLFQAMMVMQNQPRGTMSMDGLQLEWLEVEELSAKFDLTLLAGEVGQGVQAAFVYSTDVFESATIERMLGHFQVLLEAVVQEPEAKLERLPLLTSVEQQCLSEWNETTSEVRGGNVVQLFEEQVARTPEQVAVVCGAERITYTELNERAEELAEELWRRGVGPEVLVGVCCERSVELVVALLGVLKAGGAYVPLDAAYPKERLRFMIADAKPQVIVTQRRLLSALPEIPLEVLLVEEEVSRQGAKTQRERDICATSLASLRLGGNNLAYVIYTSGSTGQPKGTLITHGGLLNYLSWAMQMYPLAAGRGTPLHSSLSFDLTVTSIYPALLTGRYVEIIPEAAGVLGLSTALADQPDYSLVKLTPAHVQLLATQLAEADTANLTAALVIGGENLLAETVKWWREQAPHTRLFNEYGPTETVVGCCVYEVQAETEWSGSIPIGKPIANTRLYIMDEAGQVVPVGVTGELYIGGAGVGRGYLQRPDLTAARFVPDPFSPAAGARLYRSGDVARYHADGVLEYLGRIDEQVKVRGYRVELGEIEAVLSAHEQVREAVVVAREENGERRLVAYVVGEADTAELRRYLQERLPEYMIPTAWLQLEALPLTPNGKVDRRALPAPDASQRPVTENAYVAPRTPTEARLAAIWSEVLQLEQVGIHDNFFTLGGHSLLATQVVSRLRSVYNVELPLRRLFESPTVANLAVAVVQEQAAEVDDDEMAQMIAELEYLSDADALARISG